MRKVANKKKRFDYRHIICIVITLGFLAIGIFRFFDSVGRVIESVRDLILSVAFYFCELFQIPHEITPTVSDYPKIPFFDFMGGAQAPEIPIPDTFEGFAQHWKAYWQCWATMENFVGYLSFLGNVLYYICMFILCAFPVLLIAFLVLRKFAKARNNNWGKDTKPLRIFKRISTITYRSAKHWIIAFVGFVRTHGVYWIIWLCMWLFYFNAFTIFLELIAFYLYFVVSFDFDNIYRQVYKLFLDLWTPFTFIPVWCWVLLALFLIDRWRRKIGYAVLHHNEMKNRGFINERPIVLMACGTMGKKKTTMITDMALSQEAMLRDKAFEKILENDLKFPYFPWMSFENAIKRAMARHEVYNLATCKVFVQRLACCFYAGQTSSSMRKCVRRHWKKLGYRVGGNLLFDYDYVRYGFTYDDKLKVVDVWDVLETYAQLYFIYVIQSSLIISNYAIRTDNLMSDIGNFPLWNTDFFRRDSRLMDAYSRHSHIVDFDALRLGKRLVEENPFKDSFEFGVLNLTEIGKERKNMLELQGMKKLADATNQKNDGFNDWLKMIRHSATVDYFPFVKVITDEQRPESWGADARELCEIVHIRESGETQLAMPFFFIAELLYSFVFGRFVNLYSKYPLYPRRQYAFHAHSQNDCGEDTALLHGCVQHVRLLYATGANQRVVRRTGSSMRRSTTLRIRRFIVSVFRRIAFLTSLRRKRCDPLLG